MLSWEKNEMEFETKCLKNAPSGGMWCSLEKGHQGSHEAHPAHDVDEMPNEVWADGFQIGERDKTNGKDRIVHVLVHQGPKETVKVIVRPLQCKTPWVPAVSPLEKLIAEKKELEKQLEQLKSGNADLRDLISGLEKELSYAQSKLSMASDDLEDLIHSGLLED